MQSQSLALAATAFQWSKDFSGIQKLDINRYINVCRDEKVSSNFETICKRARQIEIDNANQVNEQIFNSTQTKCKVQL